MRVDFLTSVEVSNSVWRGKVLDKSVIMSNLHKYIKYVYETKIRIKLTG